MLKCTLVSLCMMNHSSDLRNLIDVIEGCLLNRGVYLGPAKYR